jgi:hypothetical protein
VLRSLLVFRSALEHQRPSSYLRPRREAQHEESRAAPAPIELLIGGLNQERYKTFDASCGVIPAPVHDAGEPATGELVTFNVCWQVDAAETERAFIEVDQFGVGVDAEPVQLLLPVGEGLAGAVADAQGGAVQLGDEWIIEVEDVRVDDLDKLRELAPEMEGPREDEAFVWVEARVTNSGEFEDWPASFVTEWFITGADGVTRYDDSYLGTCPDYPSPLTDRSIADPGMEAGQTLLLAHCWKVAADDVEGATLQISTIGDEATFDLGL